MKVLHYIPVLKYGGVETTLLGCNKLLNQYLDYEVVSLFGTQIELESNGNKFNYRVFKSPLSCDFFKYLFKADADVVITSLWKSLVITPFVFFSKSKHIHLVHSSSFRHVFDAIFTYYGLLICDKIVCDSESSRNWIESIDYLNVFGKKLHSVKYISPRLKCLKTASFIDDNHFKTLRLVSVGRVHSIKGYERTVHLLKKLYDKGVSFTYHFYGPDDGSLESVLNCIDSLGLRDVVSYKGLLTPDSVSNALCNYNVFIQSSFTEGLSISTIEAKCSGLACFITPVGEIPNYCVDGYDSHFIDYDSPTLVKDLVSALDNRAYLALLANNALKCNSQNWSYPADIMKIVNDFNK